MIELSELDLETSKHFDFYSTLFSLLDPYL